MKKLIIIVFLLIPAILFGQRTFVEGLIIGSSGDTVGSVVILNDTTLRFTVNDTIYDLSGGTFLFVSDTAAMLTNYALLLEIDHNAIINTHNLTIDITDHTIHNSGLRIGDSIAGSYNRFLDSLVVSATDTAIYTKAGQRVALGLSVPRGSGGVSNFLNLTDTPNNYTDDGYADVKVNLAEDALMFLPEPVFNVKTYGATGDGITDDRAAIQAAINAAHVAGGTPPESYIGEAIDIEAGTVYIPAGDYYIGGPDTLKSYVHIDIAKGAKFSFPVSYSGAVWTSPTNEALHRCRVTGGVYSGSNLTWTWVDLTSTDNLYPIMSCYFGDAYIDSCNIAINMEVTNNGWINANTFSDLQIWRPIEGVKTREGGSSLGIDGNKFINIDIQSETHTTFGVDSLSGSFNSFINFMCWDFSASMRTAVLTSTSTDNTIIGGSFGLFSDNHGIRDNGLRNLIINRGGIISEVQQPLRIWRPNDTYSAELIVSHNGGNGTAGSPSGTVAIKLSSNATALGDADSTNYSARITSKNEANDNYGSYLYFQTHGISDDNSTGGYSSPVILYPNGNIEFPRRIIQSQRSGSLTDNVPTTAEINAITFDSPVNAGAGYQVTIKDTDGSGLLYRVESDGTNWYYSPTTTDGVISVASLASAGGITGRTKRTLHTAASVNLTVDSCLNKMHVNNDADVIQFNLPAASPELVAMFYDDAGGVITIHPDGTDIIKLNGTALDAGDTIDSPGNSGDYIVMYCMNGTTWVTLGRSGTWIDGGP